MATTKLPDDQFSRMIAFVKRQHIDKVQGIRAETFNALKRIGARRRRDVKLCPPGIPDIDDRFDMSVYRKWMMNIDPSDKHAVNQLLAIDAACVWRKS